MFIVHPDRNKSPIITDEDKTIKSFWDERYANEDYAYGEEPNLFFKEQIDKLTPGKILIPAAGEGRDAVYAAKMGWDVFAFDISSEAKEKAMKLAAKHNVAINYQVYGANEYKVIPKEYDAVALIYMHLNSNTRFKFFKKIRASLKDAGRIIIEGFSENQLINGIYTSGGPKDRLMLYTIEKIRADFRGMKFLELDNLEIELNEGTYHRGLANIIRCVLKEKK